MKTIGLCMIVKNESHVILRCLDSVRRLVDYVLIEDTGSSDGTRDIVRGWLAREAVPGEVFDAAWRDFAHNRSLALARLRERTEIDYALIIDADDVLVSEEGFDPAAFKAGLTHDVYNIVLHSDPIRHQRPLLCSNRREFFYRGVLHEFLVSPNGCSFATAVGLHILERREGARSRDPDKYRKDAAILEQALAAEEDPQLRSRYTFYLAQSWRDCGEAEKALAAYLDRAALGFWDEEVFLSLYNAAQLKERLQHPGYEIVGMFLRAYEACPHRAEALHGAARYCRATGRFHQGYMLAKHGLTIPQPGGGLFVEPWTYEFGLLDEFAVNAYWVDQHQDCVDACERLLREGRMPDDMRERVELNARFARDKLALARSPAAPISPSRWSPEQPAAGTELMASGLRERLGPELDRINLQINHPGQDQDQRPRVVWIHHDTDQEYMSWCRDEALVRSVDRFVFVSEWQRDRYLAEFAQIPPDRCSVLRNATDVDPLRRAWQPGPVWRCAYASMPFRGLAVLLDAWELLRPTAGELHIWSSMRLYLHDDQPYRHLYERAKSLSGVIYHGIVPNLELRRDLRSIEFLAYPCTFAETSCLTAIEAMAAGCRVIVPELGALPETTAGFARLYRWTPEPAAHAVRFADVLAAEFEKPWGGDPQMSLAQQNYCAAAYGWEQRLDEWRRLIDNLCSLGRPAFRPLADLTGDRLPAAPPRRTNPVNEGGASSSPSVDPAGEALSYRYNGGGLNNQKLALFGLFLKAWRDGPRRVVLPELRLFDHNSFEHGTMPFEDGLQRQPLLDFANRYGIEIVDVPPRGDEGAWDYFREGQHFIPRAALLGELTPDSFACAFLRSLTPAAKISGLADRLIDAAFGQRGVRVAAQLRIEYDWNYHATRWLPDWLGPAIAQAEENQLSFIEIIGKINNTPEVRGDAGIYVACDESALPVPKEEIRAVVKRQFGVDLYWKSDFFSTGELLQLSVFGRSAVDFEACIAADAFVGLSRSTFSDMVSLEKYARTSRPVEKHYVYNIAGPRLAVRTDNGAFETAELAVAADPWDDIQSFNVAQVFQAAGDRERALERYSARADAGPGDRDEVYLSLYRAAQIKAELGFPATEVIGTYLRAAEAVPGRAEARHGASRHARYHNRFSEGYEIAKPGIDLAAPAAGSFVEHWIYDYGLLDEFAVNAYWSEHYRECLEACERLLAGGKLPEEMRARVTMNAGFAREKLGAAAEAAAMLSSPPEGGDQLRLTAPDNTRFSFNRPAGVANERENSPPFLGPEPKPDISFFGDGEARFGEFILGFCDDFRDRAGRMTELCVAMSKEGSDKGGNGAWHNYSLLYDHLLGQRRHAVRNVFELGIGEGASLRGWRNYFPSADIFGGDIDERVLLSEPRIATFQVDQTQPDSIAQLWKALSGITFDLIIDDGRHDFAANSTFLVNSCHQLAPRGIYIIEDIVINADNLTRFQQFLSTTGLHGCLIRLPHAVNHYDNCVAVLER